MSDWHHIVDYEVDPMDLASRELQALSRVWTEHRNRIGESSANQRFLEQLKREWAIETGLIERLYTLDRGTTLMLIEKGIDAALIPHRATESPQRAAELMRDQQDAVESIFSFVKGERPLSTGYIKELHSLFTRRQEFAEGIDQFGNPTRSRLSSGEYKQQPNNPTRPDGMLHHYCPPVHVAAEMDQLIALHEQHTHVPPEVEAAWLHHRFTRIHPFQDGNGRLARALATLVFVKAGWLPLVVRDEQRSVYINALEVADQGNLRPLVDFFCARQRSQFVTALGVARAAEQAVQVERRVDSIRNRLRQRQEQLVQEWQEAKNHARCLHQKTCDRLQDVRRMLQEATQEVDEFKFLVDDESDEGARGHYYQRQIVSTAKALGYFANRRLYRSWVCLILKDGSQSHVLISFHVLGHAFEGVLACSATWFQRVSVEDGVRETQGEMPLSDSIFQINYLEESAPIHERFDDWLEAVIERGLALWEETL